MTEAESRYLSAYRYWRQCGGPTADAPRGAGEKVRAWLAMVEAARAMLSVYWRERRRGA